MEQRGARPRGAVGSVVGGEADEVPGAQGVAVVPGLPLIHEAAPRLASGGVSSGGGCREAYVFPGGLLKWVSIGCRCWAG